MQIVGVRLQHHNGRLVHAYPYKRNPFVWVQTECLKPYKLTLVRFFSRTKRVPPLPGLITGSPNLVRNAPENLLLSAKRRRPCRACPCECRPAPQKEVLGRSICYPSTRRSAWTNRRRGSGYLLFLVPRCSWGEGGAGRHEPPEGNGATWS